MTAPTSCVWVGWLCGVCKSSWVGARSGKICVTPVRVMNALTFGLQRAEGIQYNTFPKNRFGYVCAFSDRSHTAKAVFGLRGLAW